MKFYNINLFIKEKHIFSMANKKKGKGIKKKTAKSKNKRKPVKKKTSKAREKKVIQLKEKPLKLKTQRITRIPKKIHEQGKGRDKVSEFEFPEFKRKKEKKAKGAFVMDVLMEGPGGELYFKPVEVHPKKIKEFVRETASKTKIARHSLEKELKRKKIKKYK